MAISPITKIEYVDQPLVMPRYTPDTSGLANLAMQQGRDLSELSLRRGANSAQLMDRLGSIFSGYQAQVEAKRAAMAALAQREKERGEDRGEREGQKEADRQAQLLERGMALRAAANLKAESDAKDLVMDTPVGPMSDTDPRGRVLAQAIRQFPSLAGRFGTTPRLESTPLGMGQEVEAGPLLTRMPTGVESRQMATDAATAQERVLAQENRVRDDIRAGTAAEAQAKRDAEAARHMRALEAAAVATNARLSGPKPPSDQRIDRIGNNFKTESVVKKAQTMAEAVDFVKSLDMETKNPSDDQALIYAFAKVMDPESVVREGEYATVMKYSQSWADKYGFDIKRIFSNTVFLTPEARKNMKTTIESRFDPVRKQYNNLRKSYVNRLNKVTGGTDGEDYLNDYGAAFPEPTASGAGGGAFSVTDPNGDVHPFATQAEADAFKKLIGG